jgi:hypothetical protein
MIDWMVHVSNPWVAMLFDRETSTFFVVEDLLLLLGGGTNAEASMSHALYAFPSQSIFFCCRMWGVEEHEGPYLYMLLIMSPSPQEPFLLHALVSAMLDLCIA